MKIIITEGRLNSVVLKWLDKEFGDLTPAVVDDKTFYVDKDRKPLFYYYQDSKYGNVYVNYDRIWAFFDSIFGMNVSQSQKILKVWLEETYNLRGVTPKMLQLTQEVKLEETYKIKKPHR